MASDFVTLIRSCLPSLKARSPSGSSHIYSETVSVRIMLCFWTGAYRAFSRLRSGAPTRSTHWGQSSQRMSVSDGLFGAILGARDIPQAFGIAQGVSERPRAAVV